MASICLLSEATKFWSLLTGHRCVKGFVDSLIAPASSLLKKRQAQLISCRFNRMTDSAWKLERFAAFSSGRMSRRRLFGCFADFPTKIDQGNQT